MSLICLVLWLLVLVFVLGGFGLVPAARVCQADSSHYTNSTGVPLGTHWGGPLWRPWNPLRFWRLVLGPSMDKIFARVVIRLAASHCS